MTSLQITAPYTHGLGGLILAYTLTLLAMGAALCQRRAGLASFLGLPLHAVPVCGFALLCWAITRSLFSSYLGPDGLANLGIFVGFE